ncbi:hypothetical protein ZWY2020_060070 [Hordeum vulgare]|nr:hypothetical protein ZWY2020_060070 [Hordeum vulgare]
MKEAIRMVPESIYYPEFPDTSHSRSGRGCHSALRRIKEEWGTSCWFLEFDTRKWGEKGPDSIPNSVLLSALPGNIYLHKLDQEIGRIRQKHEIALVVKIRLVLLRIGRRIDDQEKYGKEASFNAPQDNRALIVGMVKSIQRKATFRSLVSSWHTPTQAPSEGETEAFRFPLQ